MPNKINEEPFHSINKDSKYIVIGMYTDNLESKAQLLCNSLKKFSISHQLIRVPNIHRSISSKGTVDSKFSKPYLIKSALLEYKLPILYIDVDCIVSSYPIFIESLSNNGYEFAVFNWFSIEQNDAYTPLFKEGFNEFRYFQFSHSIPYIDCSQLRCSGAVQFWSNTSRAQDLLSKWEFVIANNPYSADDHCLDFAFNNTPPAHKPKYAWLPKSYARYAFWIFEKPVINHPDFPATGEGFVEPISSSGEKIFYVEQLKPKFTRNYLEKNECIDIDENIILLIDGEKITPLRRNTMKFWITK